jgi:hypothetical protein
MGKLWWCLPIFSSNVTSDVFQCYADVYNVLTSD